MTTGTHPTAAQRPDEPAFGKALICVTEDWFALSHFKPLIRAVAAIVREVVVVTRASGQIEEIAGLGVRVVEFDFHRASLHPVRELRTVLALRQLIAQENPDVVHMIALKPIVLGSLAMGGRHARPAIVHVTGLGLIGIAASPLRRLVRWQAFAAIERTLRRSDTHLLIENPDDLDLLRGEGIDPGDRWTLLGGAGVDPQEFQALESPGNAVPVAAHVGRMIRSKGVDTLMAAAGVLRARGVELVVDLYGQIDVSNPDALSKSDLAALAMTGVARWHGHVADVPTIWRHSDIFVLASRGGEGLPRALLEAAACGRPLVVTDVPGCRQFVRDGVEGFVVPPDDPAALADALQRLARDPALRERMGQAARERLLAGYSEAHLTVAVQAAYAALGSRLP